MHSLWQPTVWGLVVRRSDLRDAMRSELLCDIDVVHIGLRHHVQRRDYSLRVTISYCLALAGTPAPNDAGACIRR
jgi:hypothetical protein